MPKQLFDGFGNVVTAYTQDEVDALEATIKQLQERIKKLEKPRKVAKKTLRST